MSKSIEKIVAVSGLPGLYILDASLNNGLILKDMDNGNKQFVSSRKHQFTPLQSIAIYTYMDSTPLSDIFETITTLRISTPIPDQAKASSKELSDYFRTILPDYDEDRVYSSDMKKVLKWFLFLDKYDFFAPNEGDEIESTSEEE